MLTVVPIKRGFENPKAFLQHIAEDDEIQSLCIVACLKDGTFLPTHLGFTGRDFAFAGAMLTKMALEASEVI